MSKTLFSEAMAYHELRAIQNYIYRSDLAVADRMKLKNFSSCSRAVIPMNQGSGVFLLSDGEQAHTFFGVAHCNNSWYCPICAPKKMMRVGNELAVLLDNIKNYVPLMLTFTIPHLRQFSCATMINSLMQAWQQFAAGTRTSTWSIFKKRVGLKYYMKATEVNYGRNGWHPHFHMIIWVKDVQAVSDAEQHLRERWATVCKSVLSKNLTEKQFAALEIMLRKTEHRAAQPVYLSRNDDGSPRWQESSWYISGWGADKELSGLARKHGHLSSSYTAPQLLSAAIENNDDALYKKYLEFCLAIAQTHLQRFNFSRGLHQLYKLYSQQTAARDVLSKKKPFKVLCWFTREQWYLVCDYERDGIPMRSNILYLARFPDLLHKYLLFFEIYAFENGEHPCHQAVERCMSPSMAA